MRCLFRDADAKAGAGCAPRAHTHGRWDLVDEGADADLLPQSLCILLDRGLEDLTGRLGCFLGRTAIRRRRSDALGHRLLQVFVA